MPEREAAAKASVTAAKLALGASLEMLSLALAMRAQRAPSGCCAGRPCCWPPRPSSWASPPH